MKKTLIFLLAGTIAASAVLTSCSVKTKDNSNSSSVTSAASKYSSNEFYEKSVTQLKNGAGLSDQEADDAFGVLLDCGLVTKNITLVTKKTDLSTGENLGYSVWIELNEYLVVFDDNKKITKITNALDNSKVYYENGTVVTEAPTTEAPTTEVPTTKAPTTEAPAQETKPVETKAATTIQFTNYTNYVEAGSNATVTIQGAPNTEYKIHVYYDSGESKAQGLEPKTSDANGNVTWEWKVGPKTTPGLHAIKVEGGGAENSVQFEVLEEM